MQRFRRGDPIVLREIWDERVWSAIPARVVEDVDDRRLLFISPGTVIKAPRDEDGRWLRLPVRPWTLADRAWEPVPILSFAVQGIACGFLLMWDEDWRPLHWYLNLESPLRPTALGFDYIDHVLDAIVEPDGSWRWKDEDELAEAVERGLFTAEEAAAFRAEGESAVASIVRREPPFDRDWWRWRPDPSWPPPTLPEGWDRL